MSARVYYYKEDLGRSLSTSTNYSTVKVTLPFLPNPNKTYAIFWNILIDGNSTSQLVKARLQNTTAASTLAEQMIIPGTTGTTDEVNSFGGVCLYTAPGSPAQQTIEIQVASGNASTTLGAQEACILILELVDSVDIWNSSTGSTAFSTQTYTSKVSLSWTPASTGDYFVFMCADVNRSSGTPRVRLNVNSGTLLNIHAPNYLNTGTTEYIPYIAAAYRAGASGAQTSAVEASVNEPSGASITLLNAYGVALRHDQFDAAWAAEDRTAHNPATTTYADSATTGNITTDVSYDHMVVAVGQTTTASGAFTSGVGQKINAAGTDVGTQFTQNLGGGTWMYSWLSLRVRLGSGTSSAWKTQYNRNKGTDTVTSDEHAIGVFKIGSRAPKPQNPMLTHMTM